MNIFIVVLYFIFKVLALKESCDDMLCSNVYDPVCGETTAMNGAKQIHKFHNICFLRLMQCENNLADVHQIPDEACHIEKAKMLESGRRLEDFSIVGAHQACNHTCPTYCLDTYDPACAQIWARDMQSYVYRPMINHCHIDLYSCVAGVNVTIQPLIGKCYKNPSAINFMLNVASMKTLKLLDEPISPDMLTKITRRAAVQQIVKKEMKDFLRKLGHRIKMIR